MKNLEFLRHLAAIALIVLMITPGCSRRSTTTRTTDLSVGAAPGETTEPLEPIRFEREDLSDDSGQKLHLRIIVPENASAPGVDELIRRTARDENIESGELWISVFLDGMDTNALAYALGITRPGQPISITHRDSLQTYR